MFNMSWDVHFILESELISRRSKDPSTKCGATIVRRDKTIASKGYNGFPMRMFDCLERYANRQFKLDNTLHAEENAMLFCQDPTMEAYAIYTYPIPPCYSRCGAQIIQAGFSDVIAPDTSNWAAWHRHGIQRSLDRFRECGINVRLIPLANIAQDGLTMVE